MSFKNGILRFKFISPITWSLFGIEKKSRRAGSGCLSEKDDHFRHRICEELTHARILLKADTGEFPYTDKQIQEAVEVLSTIAVCSSMQI